MLFRPVPILSLVIFRIVFGLLLAFAQLRYIYRGWVDELLINPTFHFTYSGFEWVAPLPSVWMYTIVWSTVFLGVFISIGFLYRLSCFLFFVGFTYLELIDKAYYLNHYYFVSLMVFLMISLPAHRNYSIDNLIFKFHKHYIPRWCLLAPRLLLGIVYFFAGVAKIKYDWLILAQPMKIWLHAREDLPVLGPLLALPLMPYIFSWLGMLYDLSIPFFLSTRKTRHLAYGAVILFHLMTFLLFYIGMFPWIMMASTLIFFEWEDWKRFIPKLALPSSKPLFKKKMLLPSLVILFLVIQLILPLRHYFYPGSVLENEKGIRFAWHVMVMEKTGYVEYEITSNESGKTWKVLPSAELSLIQEKQMSHQKDMIIQYGQHLKNRYESKSGHTCRIIAKNWTSLNGRPSELRIIANHEFE